MTLTPEYDPNSAYCNSPTVDSTVGTIAIYGVASKPTEVILGDGTRDPVGDNFGENSYYDEDAMRLQIGEPKLNWCDAALLELSWNWN